jgi:hypothetical protein
VWASYKRPTIVNNSESRLRICATPARDAALTVPTAATSASFDLLIMVLLPLYRAIRGHDALAAGYAAQIGSAPGFFNRVIFEWTVHADETAKYDVPEETSADCSLRAHKLFPIRPLIERHWRSHLQNHRRDSEKLRSAHPQTRAIITKGDVR